MIYLAHFCLLAAKNEMPLLLKLFQEQAKGSSLEHDTVSSSHQSIKPQWCQKHLIVDYFIIFVILYY